MNKVACFFGKHTFKNPDDHFYLEPLPVPYMPDFECIYCESCRKCVKRFRWQVKKGNTTKL